MRCEEERAAVITACRALAASGLVRGTSGNVSIREAATGLVAASPSGADYADLELDDVAVVDASGEVLEGRLQPTSELGLHLGIYGARPDVQAVVHTHSMFATTYAVLHRELPAVHYLLAKAGTAVRVAAYERYGSPELAEACTATLGDDHAVLLANHGVVAVGVDITAAMGVAEAVETCAELAYRSEVLGTPHLLPPQEMAAVSQQFGSYGRATRR